MYNQPYFRPGYWAVPASTMMRGGMFNNTMNGARLVAQSGRQGMGLFSRLGGGFQAIKKVNWGGLINNASKTLNVVNQAIPLVRQVGPMVNNVKSMLRVASIFKDETDIKPSKSKVKGSNLNNKDNNYQKNIKNNSSLEGSEIKEEISKDNSYDNSPTFFINS